MAQHQTAPHDLVTRLREHRFVSWAGAMETAADKIERLLADVRGLRSVVQSAIQWDGQDDEGVNAVWLEAAHEALKDTAYAE